MKPAPLKDESVARTDTLYTTKSLSRPTHSGAALLLAPQPAALRKDYVCPVYTLRFMAHKNKILLNPIYMAGAKAVHINQRELLEEFDPLRGAERMHFLNSTVSLSFMIGYPRRTRQTR